MHKAVEFLLARPQADSHHFLEAAVFELLPELVAFLACGKGSNDAVQKVDMSGQVVRSVPFDSANIGSSWDWRMFASEVSRGVGIGSLWGFGIRYDIRMVQEYPEDLLGHVAHFSLPDTVRSRVVDRGDEARRL